MRLMLEEEGPDDIKGRMILELPPKPYASLIAYLKKPGEA